MLATAIGVGSAAAHTTKAPLLRRMRASGVIIKSLPSCDRSIENVLHIGAVPAATPRGLDAAVVQPLRKAAKTDTARRCRRMADFVVSPPSAGVKRWRNRWL